MNVQKFVALVIIAGAFLFVWCCTGCRTTGAVISDNGVTTQPIRDGLSDIQRQQADSAAAAQSVADASSQVADDSRDVADGIRQTADALNGGTGADADFESVCEQVRKQPAGADN